MISFSTEVVIDTEPKHLQFIQLRTLSCNGEMLQMINHIVTESMS